MRKIYLVKKNPELPADGNNWLVMNSFEFRNFIQTPEGQKRRDRFGQLDACSVDDVIIIAECGTETAKQWRSEKDRHDYLVSIENQSGMTVFSYNTQTTTEDDSRINNNRAEEMLLCIYHLLQPDRRIDEGIYNDEIDQYFSYREWKKKHQSLSGDVCSK